MKRINEQNNSPEVFDQKFNGCLGIIDMERHYKLAKYFKSGTYVDVGCFDSIMPILFAEHPENTVYAVDYAPRLIEFLQERFPKVKYIRSDVTFVLPVEKVDYIVAGEFIEHLTAPQIFIESAMKTLNPGGWLAISTPLNEKNHSVGGPLHVWSFTEDDIRGMGFTEIEILDEPSGKTILAWQQK